MLSLWFSEGAFLLKRHKNLMRILNHTFCHVSKGHKGRSLREFDSVLSKCYVYSGLKYVKQDRGSAVIIKAL